MIACPARDALTLRRSAPGTYVADSLPDTQRSVVFGGQLLGQSLVAASTEQPAKRVRQLHTVFSYAGDTAAELQIAVTQLHNGRSLGSSYVNVSQSGRTVCASLVLHDSPEDDVLRATIAAPDVPEPDMLPADRSQRTAGAEVRPVDGVDLETLSTDGPAELATWVRWDDPGTSNQAIHQALLAWFTDPFVIPAAMRPHPGLSLSMSHVSLSTGVLSHTVTFHELVDAARWLLIHQRAVHGGSGRVYGEGNVFTADGALVASFVQQAMIRAPRTAPGIVSSAIV